MKNFSENIKYIGLGDRTDTAVDDLDADFVVRELFERLGNRLDRTLNVCLDDKVEIFDLALSKHLRQILKSHSRGLMQLLFSLLDTALLNELSCHLLIGYGIECLAGFRYFRKT